MFRFLSFINLLWGHVRAHTKFGPDRFSRFNVYWIPKKIDKQIDKQTDKLSLNDKALLVQKYYIFHNHHEESIFIDNNIL